MEKSDLRIEVLEEISYVNRVKGNRGSYPFQFSYLADSRRTHNSAN